MRMPITVRVLTTVLFVPLSLTLLTGCSVTVEVARGAAGNPAGGFLTPGTGPQSAGASPLTTSVGGGLPLPPGSAGAGGPGPYGDELRAATSNDGFAFTPVGGTLFAHASVPAVVELSRDGTAGARGTRVVYFVDFTNRPARGREPLTMATSADGRTWSTGRPVVIRGMQNGGAAVDPSVRELPDGRIRMYYFGSQGTADDPAAEPGPHAVYSAVSTDGNTFDVEGECFAAEGLTDPEVFPVGSAWWMLFSRAGETFLATSPDGRRFTLAERFRFAGGGIPGGVQLPDGRVRIFAAARDGNGIVSALCDPDPAAVPVAEQGARIERGTARAVADPSCIRLADGSFFMLYKVQN